MVTDFDLMDERAKAQAERAKLVAAASKGGHVVVRILREGKYSDFSTPPKVGSQKLAVGDEVEFPTGYAEGLVGKGYAELVSVLEVEEKPAESDISLAEPEATSGAVSLAQEQGLDLRYVTGTGRGGRITVKDVQGALSGEGA